MLVKHTLNIAHRGTRGLASALLSKSEKDWLSKSASQLRSEAKARGLSSGGSKAEIARRLVKAEQQTAHFPSAASADASSSPAQQPSTRQFTSSARFNRPAAEANTKFTPKRPYILNVQIPEEREPVEEGPTIPYLPDYFQSHHSQSASPRVDQPSPAIPRVLTVASAATHISTPSHGVFTSTDPHLHEVHGERANVVVEQDGVDAALSPSTKKSSGSGVLADVLDDLGLGGFKLFPAADAAVAKASATASEATGIVAEAVEEVKSAVSAVAEASSTPASETEAEKGPTTEPLKAEEKQGLYALAGIIASGLLFSKVLS